MSQKNLRRLNKCGFFILDENNNPLISKEGNLLSFSSKEEAEKYLADNNISGTVK